MKKSGPVRIVVVDDSPTACELMVQLLQADAGVHVVGVGRSGSDAIQLVRRLAPDVLAMDVRMPDMDGLEATRQIMRQTPLPIVLMTGSCVISETSLTFEALRAGALTLVQKPGLADPETSNRMVQTVKLMAGVPVIHHWGRTEAARSRKPIRVDVDSTFLSRLERLEAIGIASSTGGPGTLQTILSALPAEFPLPILIVQHVTAGFAGGLAEWLDRLVSLKVRVAEHGDRPRPGEVLLAPDDYHMQINPAGVIEFYKGELYKGLRPSANFLFKSMARSYGPRCMGVILTGMGDDGVDGLENIHKAGGVTVGQNEESCVVFGMPGAAASRQVLERLLSPEQIAGLFQQIKPRRAAVL
jgi:two-component system, chemotaxis family, protein-glutamate methylesterase/glutaminase